LKLRQAHELREAGETGAAIEAYRQVLAAGVTAPSREVVESGLSVGAVALHALLDLAGGRPERLPEAWRSGPGLLLDEVLALDSTLISEAALARLRALLPGLAATGQASKEVIRWDEPFRRRDLARRAYNALAGSRSRSRSDFEAGVGSAAGPGGAGSREWREVMSFHSDREFWLAALASDPRTQPTWARFGPGREPEDVRWFAVLRWRELVEAVRRSVGEVDPRGQFGVALALSGPDFSVSQSEPSGIEERALVRSMAAPRRDLNVRVAVAVVDPNASLAPQRRRERVFGGMILGATLLSGVAAVLTWMLLARQHRLGVQKSNFVASVSHELRAPLASVRLLADNLERDRVADPERRATTLRLIGRECRRLGVLVDNVLDMARLERGRKRLEPEPTDVPSLVREAVRVVRSSGEESGVSVTAEIDPAAEGLVATLDGGVLRQALANLIDNALKHSPSGSRVRVGLTRGPGPGEFTVSVTDAGPGIPEAERRRIFEPFHRLGSELRREQPGIGIGLSLVRQGIEAHGGRVRVEPVQPTGARFLLELPIFGEAHSPEELRRNPR
jgi:signal transduction histidine kinase